MPHSPAGLLIADDEPAIRLSMSLLLSELGYRVRSAADGFSALSEIRREVPYILLSDLNMPGMSGFELLSVVWRRYPSIHRIAMSGAFCGDEVPLGVAADAFYQKGSSVSALLKIIQSLPQREYSVPQPCRVAASQRIRRSQLDSSLEAGPTFKCPECLRAVSWCIRGTSGFTYETDCTHCGISIEYTIVDDANTMTQPAFQSKREPALSALIAPNLST